MWPHLELRLADPSPPHLGLLGGKKREQGSRLIARKMIANNATRGLFRPVFIGAWVITGR